jgi:asparagine synthase (glutamine-hydrolysing)
MIRPAGLTTGWQADLRSLDRSIRHRGPDDHGYLTDRHQSETPDRLGDREHDVQSPRVLFVHRRLSILDLSEAARQPMSRAGGRVFITYNGEVYNFRELRRELEGEGNRFHTQSDTEVVLQAYLRWGISFVARLRGIFAFAIADVRNGKAYLVRDHLGVKPLYYAKHSDRWLFSSELKSFKSILDFTPRIDPEAIRKYLHFLWIPGESTGLLGVNKLAPGCWLEIDLETGAHRVEQYWSPLRVDMKCSTASVAETEEELRHELARVVSAQMVSDVPLGAFLSGGLDSSLIVALMQRTTQSPASTYSVGYQPEDLAYDIVPDDLPFARAVSEHFGTRSNEIVLSPDVATLLPRVVATLDEPLGDPAALSSYLICQAAKKTLTVMMSGMGADEIFGGYPRQRALLYGGAYRRLPRVIRMAARRLVHRLPGAGATTGAKLGRAGQKFLGGIENDPLSHYIAMETYFPDVSQRALLSPDGLLASVESPVQNEVRQLAAQIRACSDEPLRQAMLWDLVTYLPNLNLAYTDRTSMAHGVEVRVPFLDVDLVERSMRLRSSELVRFRRGRFEGKWILKEAARTLLPDKIIWRRKAGFGAPVRSWLRTDLAEMREELLGTRALAHRGWFDPRFVAELQTDFLTGRTDHSLQIWMLMSLELWARNFVS